MQCTLPAMKEAGYPSEDTMDTSPATWKLNLMLVRYESISYMMIGLCNLLHDDAYRLKLKGTLGHGCLFHVPVRALQSNYYAGLSPSSRASYLNTWPSHGIFMQDDPMTRPVSSSNPRTSANTHWYNQISLAYLNWFNISFVTLRLMHHPTNNC